MTKAIFVSASIFIFVTAVASPFAVAQAAKETRVPRDNSTEGDCATRIEKLEASSAEGEERLAEKNEVIGFCAREYEHDNTIKRLVKACATSEEQPVVKQQLVAECQLAAFKYANALRTLKREYKK